MGQPLKHPFQNRLEKCPVVNTVFNAAQLEGIAVPTIEGTPRDFTPIERCETVVGTMPHRPAIVHGHQRAVYRPATDTLHMPIPPCFQSPEAYYATLLHELTHNADTWIMPRRLGS